MDLLMQTTRAPPLKIRAICNYYESMLLLILTCSCKDKSEDITPSSHPVDLPADSGGETGDTTDTDTYVDPYSTCSGSSWVYVATGTFLTCGIDDQGCVDCWGNQNIEDDWFWYPSGDDEPPADETFTQICLPWTSFSFSKSVVGLHGCGVTKDKHVVCWGDIENPPKGTFTNVTCGLGFSCALNDKNMAECWGDDSLYDGLPEGPFIKLSAGDYFVCGILSDGSVSCGNFASYDKFIIPPDGNYSNIASSSFGYLDACAISTDGSIDCWGLGDGQCTLDIKGEEIKDFEAGGLGCDALTESGRLGYFYDEPETYTQFDMGKRHICAVTTDGEITCWDPYDDGSDEYGYLTPPLLPGK